MAQTLSPIWQGLFWLVVLAVLVGAAWWMNRASVAGATQEGDRADLDVYADQAKEIDRDVALGRITEAEADASRLEIGRRLVKARDRALTQGPRADPKMLGAIAASVALLAGGLYALSGSPGRADLPFVARERELLSRDPATLSQNEILVLLQERARMNPSDPAPHALMGQVLIGAGRDQEALRAFQAVLRRAPNDAEAIAEAGAILVRLNQNVAGADAKAAFDAAIKINPKSPAANYYLGLMEWQGGRKQAAMAIWSRAFDALADNADGQALIAARVADAISALDRGPGAGGPGPMQKMTGADQGAFIATMVSARQARLAANPGDVALRLSVARVLIMMGKGDDARMTLLAGIERNDTTPFTVALYSVAARAIPKPSAPVTKR